MAIHKPCELCGDGAILFCLQDSAFLCWSCDGRVHGANFLVSRHLRRSLCSSCHNPAGGTFSGSGSSPFQFPSCRSCDADGKNEEVESEAEECEPSTAASGTGEIASASAIRKNIENSGSGGSSVSSCAVNSASKRRKHRYGMNGDEIETIAEETFETWGRKLGLQSGCTVPLALHAFGICLRRLGCRSPASSVRAWLAGSLWLGVRLCEGKNFGSPMTLKKLERVSGVPATIIVLAESRMLRMLKLRARKEGWAECSSESSRS